MSDGSPSTAARPFTGQRSDSIGIVCDLSTTYPRGLPARGSAETGMVARARSRGEAHGARRAETRATAQSAPVTGSSLVIDSHRSGSFTQ